MALVTNINLLLSLFLAAVEIAMYFFFNFLLS